MKKSEIAEVQRTFKQVAKIKEQAAELFYKRLFELDPSLEKLFKSDLKNQGKKLMVALATVVSGLNNLEKIIPVAQNLGVKHVSYGVKESENKTVGEALIWTLEKGLGSEFTPEVKKAWVAAYTVLAEVMMTAAREEPAKLEFKALMSQAFLFMEQRSA